MEDRILPDRRRGARVFGTFVAATATALALFGGAGNAHAAGFALKEQSAAALGNAFAGATAGAEDVTYMFFNPAGLTRHEDNQAALALSYIIPQGETNNAAGTIGVTPAGGSASSGDAADDALVPAAYGMWSLSPDLKLAVGVNVPFGLTTDYDQTWAGRYHAVESSITAININPAVAYRVNETVSLGFGLQIQYADITLSNMVPVAPLTDALFEVEGDDWAFGFNVGALFELSEATRIGVAYRSQIKQEISGTATLGAGSTSADADLTTPDSASVGVHHDLNDQWAVMGEVGWTGWSSFDEIRVVMGSNIGLGTVVVTPEDWDDVWFGAIGATWKPNGNWTLRGGLAFDQSPIPAARRTPRLTGEDRIWIALGAQFQPSPNFTIDAGYAHLFVDDVSLDVTNGIGNFTATYENSVDILTVQGVLRF